MNAPLSLSRPVATAETLGDFALDRHRFHSKRVLLAASAESLLAPNGRVMFLTSLRLLARICSNVVVSFGAVSAELRGEIESEAKRLSFNSEIAVVAPDAGMDGFDAMLFIGNPFGDLFGISPERVISITSNGWLVRISTGLIEYALPVQTNPAAAIAAASLGVTEVFKHLIVLSPRRGPKASGVTFSLYSYESGTADLGPDLPARFETDTLVVGVGAIGNGIIAGLRELTITGRIAFIDRQKFGDENLGTCVLTDRSHIGRDKAGSAAALFGPHSVNLELVPLPGDVQQLLRSLPFTPDIVLNGLDNPDARRAVQSLWADLTIDGAIGPFMCQVGRHPGDTALDIACLRCVYEPDVGPAAETIAARITGLSPARAAQLDASLTEADIADAPTALREFLRAQVGKPICSVISAATAAAVSDVDQADDFEPSAPFVATMSAAMVVGEWMKASMGLESNLAPRFQFDVLRGPTLGLAFEEGRHRRCDCVERRGVIEQVREARRHAV